MRRSPLMQRPSHVAAQVPPARELATAPTQDEAGTPPGDRRFRPDVQGLRAVAVALVVLYHAGIPGVPGGFIGVDVFFVISGFVITGLLLREQQASGAISMLGFYARRCRRIIPAATVVILATTAAAYLVLGAVAGNGAADDGRWAAVFLSNFHFESVGTNYLTALSPPSPLQNFWSLSVEEQFYLVFPGLFLVVSSVSTRMSLRSRLTLMLAVVVACSFFWSITESATHPTTSYFSPFTRAWELALGALIALAGPWLHRIPEWWSSVVTWMGLGAIVVAALSIGSEPSTRARWWPSRWPGRRWYSPAARRCLGEGPSPSSPSGPSSGWALGPTPCTSGTGRSSSLPPNGWGGSRCRSVTPRC